MESRASFKTVGDEFLRSTAANNIDTGSIPTPVTSQTTSGPSNRGIEANTGRDGWQTPVITGITEIVYAPSTIQPVVDHFKTYGEN